MNPGRRRLAAFGLLALALSAPPLFAAAKWKDPTEAEKAIVEDPAQGLVGAVYLERVAVSVDNAYISYRFAATVQGGQLVANETYEIKKPLIPLADVSVWKTVETASAKASAARAILAR